MAAPTASPFLLIQSDWDKFLKDDTQKVWVTCKTLGSPAINGTVENKNGHLKSSMGFSVIPGESPIDRTPTCLRSIDVTHSDPNCRCRFLAPESTFKSIHSKSILSLDVTDAGLGVSSCFDGKLHVWDSKRGIIRRTLEGHVGDVYSCRFFPSGVVILSAGADMQLKVWSAETGKCAATMVGNVSAIMDTAIVERGRNIVSVARDGTARLWDCSTSSCLSVLTNTECEINACDIVTHTSADEISSVTDNNEVGTDGKLLLLACEDGIFRAIDIRSRKQAFSMLCSAPLTSCCFLSSTEVACGRRDGVTFNLDIRQPDRMVNSWLDSSASVLSLLRFTSPLIHGTESNGVFAGKGDGLCVFYDCKNASEYRIQLTGSDCDPINGIMSNRTHIFTCCRDGAIRKYSHPA